MTFSLRCNIACLDGLRGFACILVLLSHAGWQRFFYFVEGLGPLGISLFFSLSGFLMAYHYLPGTISWRYWGAFLIRRLFRVYPAYAVVIMLYFLTHTLFPHDNFLNEFSLHSSIQHLLLSWGWHTFWTIPVEIKFYALFPFLALASQLFGKFRILIMGLLWSLLLCIAMTSERMTVAFFPYLFFFIGGIFASLWSQHNDLRKYLSQRGWNYLAYVCLFFIFYIIGLVFRTTAGYKYNLNYAWFFSPLMALTILSFIESNGIIQRIFSSALARFTGKISYSLYLIHDFIFHYSNYYEMNVVSKFLTNFVLSFLAAWLLYKLIENPCNNWGKKLSAKLST